MSEVNVIEVNVIKLVEVNVKKRNVGEWNSFDVCGKKNS